MHAPANPPTFEQVLPMMRRYDREVEARTGRRPIRDAIRRFMSWGPRKGWHWDDFEH